MHNIIPTFSVYIDNNINDTYNKVLDFSTYINNVDISINYINTSIAIYEKNIDNLNSIVNEYNNKDASTLTKVEIERLAV
jgi:peptidoglycan hydrolase CwlO-like protein